MLTAISQLFFFEFTLLLRRSQEWLYPIAFFLMVTSLFPFALSSDPLLLQKLAPGCIWIATLLASLLSLQTVFLTDTEDAYLDQLLLSPLPLSLVILAKLLAIWMVTALPIILLTPLVGSLFQLTIKTSTLLCFSLLLGTPAITCLGCFGAALTLGLKQPGALLGMIFLPLITPILIMGVCIMQQAEAGFAISSLLIFLASLSLLAITVLPWVIALVLRLQD